MEQGESNTEMQKAQLATEEEVTLFDKIANKQIPCPFIYEDELVIQQLS